MVLWMGSSICMRTSRDLCECRGHRPSAGKRKECLLNANKKLKAYLQYVTPTAQLGFSLWQKVTAPARLPVTEIRTAVFVCARRGRRTRRVSVCCRLVLAYADLLFQPFQNSAVVTIQTPVVYFFAALMVMYSPNFSFLWNTKECMTENVKDIHKSALKSKWNVLLNAFLSAWLYLLYCKRTLCTIESKDLLTLKMKKKPKHLKGTYEFEKQKCHSN